MNKVLDVCRYVINYSNDQDYGVSNLKLQKLLYFIQAYFMIKSKNKESCFEETIEAWDFGPVVPVAYHAYKHYGSTDIPSVDSYINFDLDDPWTASITQFDNNCICDDDKQLINDVVNKLSNYSATDLVEITHHQAPWKSVYVKNENKPISIDSIRNYFNEQL